MAAISSTIHIDRLEPAGPARTTGAGRFAVPVDLKDGPYTLGTLELVFDEQRATELHQSLTEHLAGRGSCAPTRVRSRADML